MSKRFVCLLTLMFAVMLVGGCEQLQPMGDFGQKVIDMANGRTPIQSAVRMEDQYFPDERRQGIIQLSDRDFGHHPPYTQRYAEIADNDKDFLVRATAIRALNRSRASDYSSVFVTALGDKSELVRLEACKALINTPDEKATPALAKIVSDPQEGKDTRIAAAEALKHYRNIEGARALVAQLGQRDFGIAWQSRRSLITITGKDLSYDESAWLNLLTGPGKPLG